ncbi:MAG: glycosyltransferase [Sandaracinaceae bacterium]|nr:glycosyltransferase [Sandaracinaceae bacterium]
MNALPGAANVVTYVDTRELCRKFRDVVASRFADGADTIIISFDPISAARGLHVEHQCSLRGRVTHLSGVFHPRAYFMNGERKDRIALNQCVAQAVGYDHLFFMNEECRRAHAKRWNVDLRGSAIATLPVDMCEDAWAPESSGRLRIVSVGRLVEFKAYNVEAPKMAALLRDAGLLVTWDIYGDGPLGAEIRNEIERQGVGDSVRLLGELPYRDFQKTVVGYDLFIGMGTAALESAMVGVPTICATDGERERCYGFLHELPYGNVGEVPARATTCLYSIVANGFCACRALGPEAHFSTVSGSGDAV